MIPLLPLLASVLASPLTLEVAVNRALSHDSTLAALDAQRQASQSGADALRAHYGPKLRLEGNVIVWDSEQTVSFGGGGGAAGAVLPPPTTPYEGAVAGILEALGGLGTPTTVREQITAQATVQIVQPLTGLYALSQAAEAADRGTGVTRSQSAGRRTRVELDTVQGYFRTLQAQALLRAAEQQVESLAAQEKKLVSLQANGVIGKNEVLRLQVALAAARQQVMSVKGMVQSAQAALASAVGGQPGETFELDPAAPAEAPMPALTEARQAALSDRAELKELDERVAQAQSGEELAFAKLLPEVNLIGQYQHTEGNTFSAADSFFGGLFLTWTAWEWGASSKLRDVAAAQTQASQAMREQGRKGVALEVEAVHVQLTTADGAISVAEGAVAQAEEARRLEQARLEAQQATTTDLLNAETALLQARVNLENARYERLIARARLRSAMGQPILESKSPAGVVK